MSLKNFVIEEVQQINYKNTCMDFNIPCKLYTEMDHIIVYANTLRFFLIFNLIIQINNEFSAKILATEL